MVDEIKRINPEKRFSDAVIYNKVIYYTAIAENFNADISTQTTEVLIAIETILTELGSSKSRILDATIFLADSNDFATMNAIWDNWLPEDTAPVRCTVEAKLMHPKCKIEIKIIAAQ